MRFIVIQFSAYLTEFRKTLLQSRYGVALRNLIYVKSDKKLYFLDNVQGEHCLSHPAWASVTGQPETFPPSAHNHDWADVTGEPATYPPSAHNHDWADVTGEPATYPPSSHTHDYAASNHTHSRIVGEMVIWPNDTPPSGWLLCQGQRLQVATYPALYAVVGNSYVSGSFIPGQEFYLPDLRSRVPVGKNSGQSGFSVLGTTGGEVNHTLTIAELPSHNHGFQTVNDLTIGSVNGYRIIANTGINNLTSNTGDGGAHNNMPPYQIFNFIIFAGV